MTKIGIDARPLQGETKYRGIGRSLYFLLKNLPDITRENQIIFYLEAGSPVPDILSSFTNKKYVFLKTNKLNTIRYIRVLFYKKTPLNPEPSEVDVVLQYNAELGVTNKVPCVVIFYDTIPILFKETPYINNSIINLLPRFKNVIGSKLAWHNYLRVLREYKKASRVIAISGSSKRDYIEQKIGNKNQKIDVIHLGAEKFETTNGSSKDIDSVLNKKSYILYVGGIDIRKNIMSLLNDFYELKITQPNISLVLAGKEFTLHKNLVSMGWFDLLNSNKKYKNDVHVFGFVSDAELQYLYSNALAFVFPSRYEGFGLPILEAMQASCPVICYDNSSIPEVAGKAALMVPDGESMVPAIESLIENQKLRATLIKDGLKQAQKFTWEKTAKETLKVLMDVAK